MSNDINNVPEMRPHPGLSDEINHNIAESEVLGGVWKRDIAIGQSLDIETQNHHYILTRVDEKAWVIGGHPKYCPDPTPCVVHGSTWGGSMIKIGFIGRGMRMEFSLLDNPNEIITTSTIKDIQFAEEKK